MTKPWKLRVEWRDNRRLVEVLRFKTKREAEARMAVLNNTHGAVANTLMLGRD